MVNSTIWTRERSPRRSGRECVAGDGPQPGPDIAGDVDPDARAIERDYLTTQLLFAARNLAESRVFRAGNIQIGIGLCLECDGAPGLHELSCRAGRVLELIERLKATVNPHGTGKEVATGGEEPAAGGGVRPRGFTRPACVKCGSCAGVWVASLHPEPLDLSLLGLNQCVINSGADLDPRVLYTHMCKGSQAPQGGAQ